jgi:Zn-finger nucleic acid-binding protein
VCPACSQPMVVYEFEGVEIDQCTACRGVWLDAGELETLSRLSGVDSGELGHLTDRSREGRRVTRRCARCGRRMREIRAGRGEKVVLDRCPFGHGLWFDRGELAAVVVSYADAQEAEVARFFSELLANELATTEGGA